MRSVQDVYGADMILKIRFRQGDGCGRRMDYEGTRHAGFNNQGICDEVVYAKVRSAALDEEPDEETP